jgi:hypothetical protein
VQVELPCHHEQWKIYWLAYLPAALIPEVVHSLEHLVAMFQWWTQLGMVLLKFGRLVKACLIEGRGVMAIFYN